MAETEVFLRWDGACFPDDLLRAPDTVARWCNSWAVGEGKDQPAESERPRSFAPPSYGSGTAVVMALQRAEVCLVGVSARFQPIEEFALTKVSIKHLDKVGCLVLQVRDAGGKLVYAERLSQKQVFGLPTTEDAAKSKKPALATDPNDDADEKARKAAARAKVAWAHPGASPYRISVLVSPVKKTKKDDVNGFPELHADPGKVSGDTRANTVKQAPSGGGSPPALAPDQTSVRLDGDVGLQVVPWEELFTEVTGLPFPAEDEVGELKTPEHKLAYVKTRLNQLGFHAGPIDAALDDVDFKKAVRRYGCMRAIGGKREYSASGEQPNTLDYDETNCKMPAPDKTPKFDALAACGPGGFDLDELLEHLPREKNLVQPPIEHLDQLTAERPDPRKPLRLWIDCNRYYLSAPETEEVGKYAAEAAWLSRPCVPLRLVAKLQARDEGGEARAIPEVARQLRTTWLAADPAEDEARLLDPAALGPTEASDFGYGGESSRLYANGAARSRMRTYLAKARADVQKALGGASTNNARVEVGGVLGASREANARAPFGPFVAPGVASKDVALEAFVDHGTGEAGAVAPGTLVYFRPSTLAGERWSLTARLDPERQVDARRQVVSKAAQEAFKKLHEGRKLSAATAPIESWRRLRLAAFVDWPAQTKAWDGGSWDLDAVWKGVEKELAFAYLKVVPSKPGETALPRMKPSALKLEADDFSDETNLVLKNGLKVKFASMEACVNAFLKGPVKAMRRGRALYGQDKDAFSDQVVLPRVAVKKLEVDPDKPLDLAPPAGDLPSISRIIQFLITDRLNALVAKCKAGWTGFTGNKDQAALGDLWWLLRDWKNYPKDKGDLERELQKAGEHLFDALSEVIECKGGHGPAVALPRTGKLASKDAVFTWKDPSEAATPIEYKEAPKAFQYDQAKFPELVGLMFLPYPDGTYSARGELAEWIAGRAAAAPRLASILNLLVGLNPREVDSTRFPDFLAYEAYKHFRAYLEAVLETTGKGASIVATGKLETSLPVDQRKVAEFDKTPLSIEKLVLETVTGESMTSLGNAWSIPFDEVVRKGLCCRRDGSGNYVEFADGMIVINAVVNEPVQVAGESYAVAGTSVGSPLGVVFVCQDTAMAPYALFAHEMGHVLFMDHFQNAMGLLFDHDRSDPNNIMSYPLIELKGAASMAALSDEEGRILDAVKLRSRAAWPQVLETLKSTDPARRHTRLTIGHTADHMLSKVFRPHFCGKSLLKLRGWSIDAVHGGKDLLPEVSGNDLPQEPPFQVTPRQAPSSTAPSAPAKQTVEVRLIRGEKSDEAAEAALTTVGISGYVSTMAGSQTADMGAYVVGAPLKAFSTAFGHDADAAADPGAFKVEVVDPNVKTNRVWVTLETLKPVYGGGKATSWQEWTDDKDWFARAHPWIECQAVSSDPNRYRSRYLRLVTDEADHAALAATSQALLVTDTADGGGGPADEVELLDQKVRVTYDPTPGGAPGNGKRPTFSPGAVKAEVAVGAPGLPKKKIKLAFHLFPPGRGVTKEALERGVRRRVARWVRRVFAQANLSARIVSIEHLDAPARDMLSVQWFDPASFSAGALAAGQTKAGAPSKVRLTIKSQKKDDPSDVQTFAVEAELSAGLQPPQVAAKVKQAVEGAGLAAVVHEVPPTEASHEPSADVLVSHGDRLVTIERATHDDADMPAWMVSVPAPDMNLLDDEDMLIGGSPTHRRLLRCGTSADGQIDVFVVPGMKIPGRAYPAYSTCSDARFHPKKPLARAVIMAWKSGGRSGMDDKDTVPFTLPHELGHVLGDQGHDQAQGSLMNGAAERQCTLNSPKRLYSAPQLVGRVSMESLKGTAVMLTGVDTVTDMRTNGAAVLEDWPA